jgi:predicted nucleic acid-binding protein
LANETTVMRYVLDTNIVSESTKPKPDARCLAWLSAHANDCCLTSITLAEMNFGVERLPEGKRKRALARKYGFIVQDFKEWILDFDQAAASEFGRYVAEYEAVRGVAGLDEADVRDLQIAAIARSQGWTVATRNSKHYPFVDTVNPFAS